MLLKKDENVCKLKPLFDLLQKKDLKFLDPIDVTSLFPGPNLPKVYLWNQISDPNLGIHDFLKVEGENAAQFKCVVVGQEILPIEEFYHKDKKPSDIELWEVMNALHEMGKFATYFVAEGNYEGRDGSHFCLTPYNDFVSCNVLENLFGNQLIQAITDGNVDFKTEFIKHLKNGSIETDKLDLTIYFNPDAVDYCNDIFTDHFKKTLGLKSV